MRVRLRLACWLAFVLAVLLPAVAAAENRVTLRGNYYRERSTRVLAPELVFTVDVPDERLTLGATYLLDSVSSASIATGTAVATGGDNVFHELRHEAAVHASSRLREWQLGAFFRYTTETDYIGRSLGASLGRDLLQRSIRLQLSYAFNFDRLYRIFDGQGRRLPWCGGSYGRTCDGGTNLLATHYLAASYSHAVHPLVLVLGSFEYARVDGPQDNPYRGMMIPTAEEETHPLERNRYALWASTRVHLPGRRHGRLRSPGAPGAVTLEPRYRFSVDDWGVLAHVAEARLHVRVHANVLIRFRYRFYAQSQAFFYRSGLDYAYDPSVFCTRETPQGCASADPKLSSFRSHTPGFQITYAFDGLAARTGLKWLEGGFLEATYNFVHQTSRFDTARALGSLAFSLAF